MSICLFKFLREIAKSGSLPNLEKFYRENLFGKNLRFSHWEVKIFASWVLTGFINNDFEMHKVFVKYLFEGFLTGYGDTICSVC